MHTEYTWWHWEIQHNQRMCVCCVDFQASPYVTLCTYRRNLTLSQYIPQPAARHYTSVNNNINKPSRKIFEMDLIEPMQIHRRDKCTNVKCWHTHGFSVKAHANVHALGACYTEAHKSARRKTHFNTLAAFCMVRQGHFAVWVAFGSKETELIDIPTNQTSWSGWQEKL